MEIDSSTLFVAFATVIDIIAVYRALWRTQGAERTMMWIFAIIAFPILGAAAFFALANPSITRASLRKRASAAALNLHRTGDGSDSCGLGESRLLELAAKLTGQPPSGYNSIQMLPEPPDNFPEIEAQINSAKKSIWAEFYIIQSDETGLRFLRELAKAAARGIEVRLLYDAVGSLMIGDEILIEIERSGVRVEAFSPLSPWRRHWSVHLRNHRKLLIIDGQVAHTGSMNVGNEYSGRFLKRGAERFRDIHLRIEGPAVIDLSHVFAEDWHFAVGEILNVPEGVEGVTGEGGVVSVVPSGPDQYHNLSALLYFAGLASATKRVYITTPYFIPDEAIIRAVQFAALSGVDVRLLVPAKVDSILVGPAGRYYFPHLLKAGVRIFEYLPGMLHAKSMVIDEEMALVGSANLDIRSMRLNFELGVLVRDRELNRNLAERFLGEQSVSREITLQTIESKGFLNQVVERVARLLSPIL